MAAIDVNGARYHLADDGRLQNVQDWNEAVAEALAEKEGLSLTHAHWEVINFLREYYDEYNIVPVMNLFQKAFADRFDRVKADVVYLNKLFPGTVPIQASRIAGLPTPHTASLLGDRGGRARPVTDDASSAVAAADVGSVVEAVEFEGQTIHLTKNGNLVERDVWNERLAEFLAQRQGITLTEEHWEVVRFIREFYEEFAIAPMIRLLVRHMRESLDAAKCNKEYLYRLFPGGPARQGSVIAGLAEPPGCID